MKSVSREELATLTSEEKSFLRKAQEKARANANWFEFESFAFGSRSPVFSRSRTYRHVLENPLYVALRELWLELGQRQGHIGVSVASEVRDGERREEGGRGPAEKRTDGARKRDVEASGPSARGRSSKSRPRKR